MGATATAGVGARAGAVVGAGASTRAGAKAGTTAGVGAGGGGRVDGEGGRGGGDLGGGLHMHSGVVCRTRARGPWTLPYSCADNHVFSAALRHISALLMLCLCQSCESTVATTVHCIAATLRQPQGPACVHRSAVNQNDSDGSTGCRTVQRLTVVAMPCDMWEAPQERHTLSAPHTCTIPRA